MTERGTHEHFGLLVLAGCLILAVALVAAGVVWLWRAGSSLAKRLKAYRELPLFRVEAERARQRVAMAERRMDSLPFLAKRGGRAIAELDAARRRNVLIGRSIAGVLRRTYVRPAAPRPKAERSPES